MDIKRSITAAVGLPIVIIALVFGNCYIIDAAVAIAAMMATYEYSKCISKEAKMVSWLGYLCSALIAFLHVIPVNVYIGAIILGIPTIMLVLFLHIIISDMKINFKDIAFTFMGIMYIVGFIVFIPALYGNKGTTAMENGKFLIWYLLFSSWGTDIFAYVIGRHFGKHKFSKVSPNKTIEGCIAGTIGAIIACLIYTVLLQKIGGIETYSYWLIAVIAFILSIVGQVGDFAASAIKRYFEVKDFSEVFPGHGGMLDRIDSFMFSAPYAYFIFIILLLS
jgi:phosphatidate cytidylyltransferase